MSKRKFTFVVLALAMLAGSVAAQDRLTDDRELFMGVPTASSIIRPNVMILVDVSGSMTQSIYHPYFNRKLDYSKDDAGNALTINNLGTYFYAQGGYPQTEVPYNSSTNKSMTQEFRVCRNTETLVTTYDVRAKATSTQSVNGQPTWWRWNLNSVTGTFVVNQIIEYTGTDGLTHHTKVMQVVNATRIYIQKNYEATYVEPWINVFFYVNPHIETRTLSVDLLPKGTACGAGEAAYDVKLYAKGNQNVNSEPENDYDLGYLYWLFFRATPAQIAEVNNWSNTGEFTAGVYAGRSRISVAREAVYQIISDNYDKFNLGFSTFSSNSSGADIKVRIKQQNAGNALATFQTQISAITAGGNTPLAIALADIWSYFKGTFKTNYNYNNGTQTLDALDNRPIRYWCQSNYVILMTDGESNGDRFASTYGRFSNTLLASNPDHVSGGQGGWGVLDGHDYLANDTNGNWYNKNVVNYCTNFSCWSSNLGSDWLDDIAYLMYHNDLFPNDVDQAGNPYTSMPTKQFVETFTIGFSVNNDMLYNTAEYGNTSKASGAYRTANNYYELLDAIQNFILNITLRDFGFSSFTAPKKVSSAQGEGASFVGYFKPKAGEAIWEGHLQSFKLSDRWCPDSDLSGGPTGNECLTYYGSKLACENANSGLTCYRSIALASTPDWDTAALIAAGGDRVIYTNNSVTPYTLINFTDAGNISTLRPLFGVATDADAQTIVNTIKAKHLADIFHSDIAYVGPPIPGKKYLKNLNPSECPAANRDTNNNCFEKLAATQADRKKVLYVGTNDGIVHQINATTGEANSGKEIWGFIPDEVLPSLKTIAIDNEFAFTADGRVQADDIYYRGSSNTWKTLLAFGLRDGGNAFYALDITTAATQPVVLWKFKEPTYSGKSWGKPNFGKIRYWNGSNTIDLWVVIVSGGFAFNNENPADLKGKAIFVLDASTGVPLWTLAYKSTGQADNVNTVEIDTVLDNTYNTGLRYLTAKDEFNYCIPSALVPVDRDSDGYLDTIYFGNVAGHVFKTDISATNPGNWKSYLLFKKTSPAPSIHARVVSAVGTQVTLDTVTGTFAENQNVFASGASSSHAMGIVNGVSSPTSLTIAYTPSSGPSFRAGDTIIVPGFDPVFLSPAIFFDPCFNLWVAFGTGDRLRSRTNPTSGKFAAFRDGSAMFNSTMAQKTDILESDLVPLTWTGDTLAATTVKVANKWGWYFTFPQAAKYEKMFDPEPLILPDLNMIPHIFFNTYQPSGMITGEDCNAPEEGNMKFYDVKMNFCGDGKVAATREGGRIAGGGMFQGSDFILYEGTGNVASIPPLQDIRPIKLIYTGGLLFWREKKR